MTIDPAFGAVVAAPIVLLAIACAWALRFDRRWIAIAVAGCTLGFVAGCARSAGTESSPAPAATAAVTPALGPAATPQPTPTPLSAQMTKAALAAKRESGTIAIDVLDDHQPGMRGSDDPLSISSTGTAFVIGWAFNEGKNAPCSAVAVVVDDRLAFPARYSYARPDVAAHFNNTGVTNVGYGAMLPASALGSGRHQARIVCLGAGSPLRSHKIVSITVQ
jgi:hypothetical protein